MFTWFLVMFGLVGIAMLFRAPLASDLVFAVAYASVSVFFKGERSFAQFSKAFKG